MVHKVLHDPEYPKPWGLWCYGILDPKPETLNPKAMQIFSINSTRVPLKDPGDVSD